MRTTITLPAELAEFLDHQKDKANCSRSAYVAALLRKLQSGRLRIDEKELTGVTHHHKPVTAKPTQ